MIQYAIYTQDLLRDSLLYRLLDTIIYRVKTVITTKGQYTKYLTIMAYSRKCHSTDLYEYF